MICHSNSTDKPIYTLESRNISQKYIITQLVYKAKEELWNYFQFPKTYVYQLKNKICAYYKINEKYKQMKLNYKSIKN